MMATKSHREAATILNASTAAQRLLERTNAEQRAVMSIARDELSALAQQLAAVCTIAEQRHLERVTAGSLAPDAFAGPVE